MMSIQSWMLLKAFTEVVIVLATTQDRHKTFVLLWLLCIMYACFMIIGIALFVSQCLFSGDGGGTVTALSIFAGLIYGAVNVEIIIGITVPDDNEVYYVIV